ncbi:hypothetical protein GCM10027190_26520 [Spirosoma areae]
MSALSHFATFLSACSARIGALAAMVHMGSMFFALGGTSFTKVSAELTNISRVVATAGHE